MLVTNRLTSEKPELVWRINSHPRLGGKRMRLPIDTGRLQFLVVGEAEPVRKFEEGKPREAWAPRVDDNGELLWRVHLVAFGDGGADILRVIVSGGSGGQGGGAGAGGRDDRAGVGDGRALGH